MGQGDGRLRAALADLLGADPIALLQAGRPRSGLHEAARERLAATVQGWPVATVDRNAATVLTERFALQVDRAADWVTKGPEALPWLGEQRNELVMAAYNLNRVAFRCSQGLRALGENASRYVQSPYELADRALQLLEALEARLAALDQEPVVPDRTFPADLSSHNGQQLGSFQEQGVDLALWCDAGWDPDDDALVHARLFAVGPGGQIAAFLDGRRRDAGPLRDGDITGSPAVIEAEACAMAGCLPGRGAFVVDDLIVDAAFAGHAFGPRFALRCADVLLGPEALVLLAAQPKANRLPPEAIDRLDRHWRAAGWQPLSTPCIWVRPPLATTTSRE